MIAIEIFTSPLTLLYCGRQGHSYLTPGLNHPQLTVVFEAAMSNSFPRLQNPRGGPLWNNPQSQVRGIAVKKSSSSDRGQRGPKTEHNERDERTVVIDDLKDWQPPTFRPPTSQPHKKSSDLRHHDQEILHAAHKACDFCDKNHLRVSEAAA